MPPKAPARSPDFELRGFSLWIHGWERPEADDFWDKNWLDITARFATPSAEIIVAGAIALSTDIEAGLSNFERLHETLDGVAWLASTEPGFEVKLEALVRGAIRFSIVMEPRINELDEIYRYSTEIDQTYLPAAIDSLKGVMAKYAPRGRRPT